MDQHVEMAALEAALDLWPTNTDRRERYGTGSPEGVVTAPVGTYYTDTALTNGALRWAKKTGTGTTGWVCVEGDTGWRTAYSWLINGWTQWYPYPLLVRRVNSQVLVSGVLDGTARTSTSFMAIGLGFQPASSIRIYGLPLVEWDALTVHPTAIDAAIVRADSAPTGGHYSASALAWMAEDVWPTTLPGVAA